MGEMTFEQMAMVKAVDNALAEHSVGISMFPKDGTTADSLLDAADKAMYRAKRDKSGYSFAL